MSIVGTFPTIIANGQLEDATVVMSLFTWIQSQVNGNACGATSGVLLLKGDGAGNTVPAIPMQDYLSAAQTGQVVGSITVLRTLLKTNYVTTAFVTGYYTPFDGGGGTYCYDSTDTTSADNGGSIIVANDGGRWKLASITQLSVKQFGARGDSFTDDSSAINAAMLAASTAGNGVVYFVQSTGNYKCNSGLIFYPNTVSVQGNGCTVDFSGMTTGYSISFVQTSLDANARNGLNKAHPIDSLYLIGPGGAVAVTAVKAIDQNPITGTYWLSGVTFRNCSFINFKRSVEFGNGAFLFTFFACDFAITSGTGYDYCLFMPSATNAGENNEFISCFFGIGIGSIILQQNGNSSTFFRGCSADYAQNVFYVQAGAVDWDGYIESSTDSDYWAKISGQNTLLRIAGQVVLTDNNTTHTKTAFECFYVDNSCTNGGLILDIAFSNGSTVTYAPASRNLVAGNGRTRANIRSWPNATQHIAIGGGLNFLAYGDFESANYTAEWALSGTTPPARTNAVSHAGAWSLGFSASNTNTPLATRSIPCQPGQQFIGGVWYYAPSLAGSNGTFYARWAYTDAGGNVIGVLNTVFAPNSNVSTWTYAPIYGATPAPAGAVNATLFISVFGTNVVGPIASYIDDVTLAVV